MEKENKKHGIFRIFNVFDLILIALAAALAVALVIPRLGSSEGTGTPQTPLSAGMVPVRYVIEMTVKDEDRDAVKVGDDIVDKIQHYDLGTVESIEYVDATRRVTDYANERIVNAVIPGQVTLRVTVSAMASVSDTKILLDGGFAIKLGTGVNAMLRGINLTGSVLSIDRGTNA